MIAIASRDPLGWRRLLSTVVLGCAAAILIVGMIADFADSSNELGFDFRFSYFSGAKSVVEGGPLYPTSLDDPGLEEAKAYVYPPLLAVALVPLTILPVDVAVILALLGSLAALMGALAIVGVRDVRCYAAVIVWAPAWNALEVVNVTATLTLALALAWRFRDKVWPPAVALGLAVAAKIFLWPLLVWLVATRRLRAAAAAVLVGLVGTFTAWAAVGFDGLTRYPDLLSKVSELHAEDSYSIVGAALALGFGPLVSHVLMVTVGVALLAMCAKCGRREDADEQAFTYAVAAALALTPVAWLHYLVLLVVPVAITHPRFSAVWLVPLPLWASAREGNGDGLAPLLPALVVVASLVVLLARPRARGVVAEAPA